jgi:hypothetical protein
LLQFSLTKEREARQYAAEDRRPAHWE